MLQPVRAPEEWAGRAAAAAAEVQPDGDTGPRITFSSPLVGPAARAAEKRADRVIHGVVIPHKPDEPDNCCMSGCGICVWDLYREDVESWQKQRLEARDKLLAKQVSLPQDLADLGDILRDPIAELGPALQQFIRLEKTLRERREGIREVDLPSQKSP